MEEDDLEGFVSSESSADSNDDLDNISISSNEDVKHKVELELLKEKDPEFHKYLLQNDTSLLAFEGDSEADSDNELEGGSDTESEADSANDSEVGFGNESEGESEDKDQATQKKTQDKQHTKSVKLTQSQIQTWSNQVKANSLKSTKKMLMALKAAVGKDDSTYTIDDARIFNMLAIEVLNVNQPLLNNLPKKPWSSNPKWSKIRPMIKSYLNSVLELLDQTSDENLMNAILRRVREMVPVMDEFPKISKNLVSKLVKIMSEKPEKTRMLCVLVIGDLASTLPKLYATIFKQLVSAYKSLPYNQHNKEMHDFVKLAVIQVSKMSVANVYQIAFQNLRELAMKLRAKTDLINWNHLKQLELWAELISVSMEGPLGMLAYPLIQIMLASFRQSGDLVPYNVHLLSMLVGLSTHVYIPLTNAFIDVFNKVANAKPVKTSGKKQSMAFILKAQNLHQYQAEMMSHLTSLSCRYFTHASTLHAFPELIIPFVYHLKKIKAKALGTLMDKLKETAKFVEAARGHSSPMDPVHFMFEASDTPIGKYYANLKAVKERLATPLPSAQSKEADSKNAKETGQKKRKSNVNQDAPKKKKRLGREEDHEDAEDVVGAFDINEWK